MLNIGDYVNHIKFPEEFGLGIIKEVLPDNRYKVEWQNEFGDIEISTHDENELE